MHKIISKNALSYFALAILVSGCSTAQRATDVSAIRVPIAPYLKMTCQELATEQNALVTQAQSVGAQVDDSYRSDKNTELVTWILFAPAAFWMDGNQKEASQLASIKGQLDTVQEAQKVNKCSL
jgi:hypothetical protein